MKTGTQGGDGTRLGFFDALSDTWDSMEIAFDESKVRQLMSLLAISVGDVVLDVGTGTGAMIGLVAPYEPSRVVACDISQRMLEKVALKFGGLTNLEIVLQDARTIDLGPASVDVIICNGVYPHFADAEATLGNLFRLARPGARVAVNHFIGRELVNRIHSGADNPLIQSDLLPSSEEVADLLRRVGFEVTTSVDDPGFYLVGGTKPL